ncbi:hypothetical protein ACFE04_018179 [Oxalis oulophora]
MGFSCALRSNLPATKLCSFGTNNTKHIIKSLSLVKTTTTTTTTTRSRTRRGQYSSLRVVNSLLNNKEWSSINDSGATEPARILFERLFSQTQKLEKHLNSDLYNDAPLGLGFENLESDLHAALLALKKREEDLQDAEKDVLLERNQLIRAKNELEQREEEISAAYKRQEKLQDELMQVNLKYFSQSKQIQDLNYRLEEKETIIQNARSELSLKGDEFEKTKDELMRMREEVSRLRDQMEKKTQLLNAANAVVKRQEIEVAEIRETILEREKELQHYVNSKKQDEEKVKVAEANLEKMTREWLLASEELKRFAKHDKEGNGISEDFEKVKKLLVDIQAELVSSQKSLSSSRKQMEDQTQLLMEQFAELEQDKKSIAAYMGTLKDAKLEVEDEKLKLKIAEARKMELELELSIKSNLIENLQKTLQEERSSVQQTTREISSLREEIVRKKTELEQTRDLLNLKDSELKEAMLEIDRLKSIQASLHLTLEEKDRELCDATKKLEEVAREVADLKILMSSKEDQLIQATAMLKEKDEYAQIIENELTCTKAKVSEAEEVVERIVDLTNDLVSSVKDRNNELRPVADVAAGLTVQELGKLGTGYGQLSDKLKCEELKMEILAVQKAVAQTKEELRIAEKKLDEREKEIVMLKEGIGLKKLYGSAQEGSGNEKLLIEAARLDAETAKTALKKLVEISGQVVSKAQSSVEFDPSTVECVSMAAEDEVRWSVVETEIARISALADRLVREAGIDL